MNKIEKQLEDKNMKQTIEYIEKFLEEEGTTFQDKIDYEKSKVVIEMAKKMLQAGFNVDRIAEYTGLSISEIEELN